MLSSFSSLDRSWKMLTGSEVILALKKDGVQLVALVRRKHWRLASSGIPSWGVSRSIVDRSSESELEVDSAPLKIPDDVFDESKMSLAALLFFNLCWKKLIFRKKLSKIIFLFEKIKELFLWYSYLQRLGRWFPWLRL